MIPVYCVLIGLLTGALLIDIKQQRIPNWLCLLVTILGVSSNSLLPSGLGLYHSLLGLLLGLCNMLVIYCITSMGAGDVKLMAAIGSVVGIKAIVIIFYYTFLIAGLLAVFFLIFSSDLKELLERYGRFFTGLLKGRWQYQKPAQGSIAAVQLPMAPAMALATAYQLLPQFFTVAHNFHFFGY